VATLKEQLLTIAYIPITLFVFGAGVLADSLGLPAATVAILLGIIIASLVHNVREDGAWQQREEILRRLDELEGIFSGGPLTTQEWETACGPAPQEDHRE